ncbi:ABC transporter ATP-binding protein [Paenibacillus sp. 598K]|uniref:ABC transporter ATP-binding protein n=1 Tax=Paenibacillus sp. 598K TaxID=1117987 RepID=UPI0027D8A685|nr:ABC transporter ATP-binding protein [Paenibacillus sp. 598K]
MLEDINLEFSGGVYALLAPNGAGKTTLIKMLTTLVFPTQGAILWQGDDIIGLNTSYRDMIGYLPQDFGYYKNHSPRDFLLYMSAVKGMERGKAKRRTDELLELVGLVDVRDKKMRKFSGGMIQRVGIAQAMLNDPQILILDEPTAGLDPKERVRFRNLISSLSKDRIVILSTHIVSDIETIASRVIMFKNHRLFANDTPSSICGTLAGKVYETNNIAGVKAPYLALTEHQEDGKTVTRFASESDCSSIARQVSPNLEDVFLYIYRDEEV